MLNQETNTGLGINTLNADAPNIAVSGSVADEVSAAQKLSGELHDVITNLSERLAPVLHHYDAQPALADQPTPEPVRTDLANQISSHNKELSYATRRLRGIIADLGL